MHSNGMPGVNASGGPLAAASLAAASLAASMTTSRCCRASAWLIEYPVVAGAQPGSLSIEDGPKQLMPGTGGGRYLGDDDNDVVSAVQPRVRPSAGVLAPPSATAAAPAGTHGRSEGAGAGAGPGDAQGRLKRKRGDDDNERGAPGQHYTGAGAVEAAQGAGGELPARDPPGVAGSS